MELIHQVRLMDVSCLPISKQFQGEKGEIDERYSMEIKYAGRFNSNEEKRKSNQFTYTSRHHHIFLFAHDSIIILVKIHVK